MEFHLMTLLTFLHSVVSELISMSFLCISIPVSNYLFFTVDLTNDFVESLSAIIIINGIEIIHDKNGAIEWEPTDFEE